MLPILLVSRTNYSPLVPDGGSEGRRVSWPWWLPIYLHVLPSSMRSPIQVLTGPDVE